MSVLLQNPRLVLAEVLNPGLGVNDGLRIEDLRHRRWIIVALASYDVYLAPIEVDAGTLKLGEVVGDLETTPYMQDLD